MADNYLERKYDEYLRRKAEAEKANETGGNTPSVDTSEGKDAKI